MNVSLAVMERSTEIVLSWIGIIIGAIVVVGGFVLDAFEIARMIGVAASQWQVVGAVLFFACTIFLLVKHQESLELFKKQVHQDGNSPENPGDSRPVPVPSSPLQSEPAVVGPRTSDVGVDGRINLETSPSELSDLLQKCSGMTDYHADKAKKPYIGKWLKISGDVANVERNEAIWGSRYSMRVECDYPTLDAPKAISVYMDFNADEWEDRLAYLARGEQITVLGKVEDIIISCIYLENCEIIS